MVIFAYHYFSKSTRGKITCTESQLKAHLRYLRERCNPLPLLSCLRAIEAREPLPRRTVAVTLDDCDRSFYEIAWPLFCEYQVPVFCSPPTAFLGRHLQLGQSIEVMSAAEVCSLVESGFVTLGSHSATHPHFSRLDPDQMMEELLASRQTIELIQGHCQVFTYPYGGISVISTESEAALAQAGYTYALTTFSGHIGVGSDRFRLGRTNLGRAAVASVFPYFCNGMVGRLIWLRKRLKGERLVPTASPGGRLGDHGNATRADITSMLIPKA